MKTSNDYLQAYKKQLEIGDIQIAFKEITDYMLGLRTLLNKKYADDFYLGNFSQHYLEMTYFTFTPTSLKDQKLKIGVAFNHQKLRFETWLVAQNKQIQKQYWDIIKDSDWNKYTIPTKVDNTFSIIETVLLDNPDFNDLQLLTEHIEKKLFEFIDDMKEIFD